MYFNSCLSRYTFHKGLGLMFLVFFFSQDELSYILKGPERSFKKDKSKSNDSK